MKFTFKRSQNSKFIPKPNKSTSSKSTLKSRASKSNKSTLKSRASKSNKSTLKSRASKSNKSRYTMSSRLIRQKILSGHPSLSKKIKNKRRRYISRNDVSPFRSVKEHLKELNSPLAII